MSQRRAVGGPVPLTEGRVHMNSHSAVSAAVARLGFRRQRRNHMVRIIPFLLPLSWAVASAVSPVAHAVNAQPSQSWHSYKGAWFSISYPPGFVVKPSQRSSSGDGFDSAFFIAPDHKVKFYVFSPQWSGEAKDVALNAKSEKLVSQKVTKTKDKTLTYTTIAAKNGSYTRSLLETKDSSTVIVFGVQYASAKTYASHKDEYLRFKKSLVQYAD